MFHLQNNLINSIYIDMHNGIPEIQLPTDEVGTEEIINPVPV